MTVVGLISPGEMGASVGAAAMKHATVIWAGEGRSEQSHERATSAGLQDCGTLSVLCRQADLILSVCPPGDAHLAAEQVIAAGFKGYFADCNAIAPESTQSIAELFKDGHFIDGGIVGGPAWNTEAGTRLYLSGERSRLVAELFEHSPLHVSIISSKIGAASAMKMMFAAYTKGSTALLAAILGAAEHYDVRAPLEAQWGDKFSQQAHQRLVANSVKAWRFSDEMREISKTFDGADMPGGFHEAAAEVFERLADFKDNQASDINQVIAKLLDKPN